MGTYSNQALEALNIVQCNGIILFHSIHVPLNVVCTHAGRPRSASLVLLLFIFVIVARFEESCFAVTVERQDRNEINHNKGGQRSLEVCLKRVGVPFEAKADVSFQCTKIGVTGPSLFIGYLF